MNNAEVKRKLTEVHNLLAQAHDLIDLAKLAGRHQPKLTETKKNIRLAIDDVDEVAREL